MTRTMLLEHVWDFHFEPKTSVVETHMSRLRGKVDKPFEVELIRTVRARAMSSPPPTSLRARSPASAAFRLTLRFAAIFVVCLLVADLVDRPRRTLDRARADDRRARRSPRQSAGGGCGGRITRRREALARSAATRRTASCSSGIKVRQESLMAGSLARAAPSAALGEFVPPGNDPDEGMWVRSRCPSGRRMDQCRREHGGLSRRCRAHAGRGGLDGRHRLAARAAFRRAAKPRGPEAASRRSPPLPKASAGEPCPDARLSHRRATSSIACPKA